jgi:hypothetical protein
VSQTNLTILRRIELLPERRLELDCGEDIDIVQDVGGGGRTGHNGGPQGPLCHWLMAAETSPGWQVGAPAA